MRTSIRLVALLTTLGLAMLAPLVVMRAPSWTLGFAMLVFGLGMGLANSAIVIGVQASVGWEQRGVVTAATMFSRTMGGALGVGALGALLAARLGRSLAPETVRGLLDPDGRGALLVHPEVVEALGAALDPLFWAGAVAAGLTMITVLAHPRDEVAIAERVR